GRLIGFAARYRSAVWPGYTHTRRAMPSSAGLWAAALAEGLIDSAESLGGIWPRVDRSPLGSAAGYGVPLPLDRRAAARALGFGGLDLHVTSVQNGRGKLEAAVLAWCVDVAHDLSRWATDVVLLSGEEFGLLKLPASLATGSSIMPHKRNPDLFELTRARAAALEGDFAQVLAIKAKLTSGYHRDFQLLKEPLIRGLERSRDMLAIARHVVAQVEVDRFRSSEALTGDLLATDEVMRRVQAGRPFRQAYREVAALVKSGTSFPPAGAQSLLRVRRSVGGAGALELGELRARIRRARRWNVALQTKFDRALTRLAGRGR
ncbi:MAG: lyase family protein, partial [Gemmatimonadota bacterium]